jgi:hypothetical protein
MNARILKRVLFAGLLLPLPVWGQNSVAAAPGKEVDLSAVQLKFKGIGAEQRLTRLKELSGEIPDLKYLSLDDADALAVSLGNPDLSAKDGEKVISSYVFLAKKRNWASYEPLLAQAPGRATPGTGPVDQGVTLAQFKILLEEVQKLRARIVELEGKLLEAKK